MRAFAIVLLLAICGNQAFASRQLKSYAGTPADLAASIPDLSAVTSVISALGVLPDNEIDAGITVFAPNNAAVQALFNSLSMTMPTSQQGYNDLIAKLGPIADTLVTAILYNISPGIVQLPANDGESTNVTTASGDSFMAVNNGGTVYIQAPGNVATSPNGVKVDNVTMWNGAEIVVTDEVLMPASLVAIQPTTVADGMAKLLAFRNSLAGSPGMAPAMAPAVAGSAA